MTKRTRPQFSNRRLRLGFEALEDRRLLTIAATDVTLDVNTGTGDAQLVFNGSQQISSYEIDSASGQLTPAGWKSLNSQGNTQWSTLASTSTIIAEGNLSGTLTSSAAIDLGNIFTPGGTHDLAFQWSDANSNDYKPSVVYVTQAPDMTVAVSHTGNFRQGDTADTYTILVTNSGNAATTAPVSLADLLPAGLTYVSAQGSGWGTPTIGSSVTFTRSEPLAAGASYPSLVVTVSVANNAASSVTNKVTVSGGGETNTADDTTNDVTSVAQTPTLSLNTLNITYGTALGNALINGAASATVNGATVSVPGTFAFTSAAGSLLNAGNGQTENVTFTPTDSTNFNTATANVTVNVAKATPTSLAVNPVSITYGTALVNGQLTGNGGTAIVNGSTVAVPGTYSYTTVAGTLLTAGNSRTENVTFTPTDSTNFNAASVTVTVNVAKATPSVSTITPVGITYGTALSGSQLSSAATATVNGNSVAVPGSFSYSSASGKVLAAGNGQTENVTFTPTDAADFNTVATTVTVNVAQATPSVLSVNPVSITSATALANSQLSGTAQAIVNGATVTVPGAFSYTTAGGSTLSVGAGQIENVTFTPTDTTDFTAATSTVSVTVANANAVAPTLTINPVNITYGTALGNAQLTGTAQVIVSGAPVTVPGTFTYTSAVGAVVGAGSSQTENVTFTPTDNLNYLGATNTVTVNVAKATPTVSNVNAVNITYGTALTNGQLIGTASATVNGATVSVPGTFTYTSAAGTLLNAGSSQTENVTFTPTDSADFNTTFSTVSVNVAKATPSLSITPVGITYGTDLANGQLSGTASATVNGASVSVPGTFTYTSAAGTLLNAGSGQNKTITFTPTDSADFNANTATATINVAKATPTLSVNPVNIIYGTVLANGQLGGTGSATVNGATVNVPGTFIFTSAASTLPNAGSGQTENVTFTPTDSTNYGATTSTVTVNVAKATPSVTVAAVNITYGTALANSQLGGTATATVRGTSTSVAGTYSYATASGTLLNAGSGHSESVTFTPTDSTDYNTASSTVVVNVSKATPTLSFSLVSITYGTALTNTQLSGTIQATVNGATVSVPGVASYTTAAGTLLKAGNGQTESATFTPTDAADYNTATSNVTVNVAKATPTVTTLAPVSLTYGTALSNGQLSGAATAPVNGATVNVPGSFAYSTQAGTVLMAGSGQSEGVTFTPTDIADFNTATSNVAVNVSLAIATKSLAGGTVNLAYSQTITASGGNSPYTFTVASGSLPAGLKLSSSGVLSGTPTSGGTANFTIAVSDAANPSNKTSLPYQLTVTAPANSSISGNVYIDADNSGRRITASGKTKIGLSGVAVELLSQNNAGKWVLVSGVSPVKTGTGGSYSFGRLSPGTYRVQITPPTHFLDGKDTAGKINGAARGTAGTDQITVQLKSGDQGTEYNFGMRGIHPRYFSLRFLLSSAMSFAGSIQNINGQSQISAASVDALFAQGVF